MTENNAVVKTLGSLCPASLEAALFILNHDQLEGKEAMSTLSDIAESEVKFFTGSVDFTIKFCL